MKDPNWQKAIHEEYNALIANRTWVLVPRPTGANVVWSMWLFKKKFNAYESILRYKTRLIANRHNQHLGINCDETFSLVVKPSTIHTILNLTVSRQRLIHQIDMKNAFLHGHLHETI